MATKRTIDIDIKNNANKTAKDMDNLNKSLSNSKKAYDKVLKSGDSFEKQLKDIDNIVKTTPLNVRDMNKQIQAYQSIALSAGRESPIGRDALEKASMLRDKYVDIQNETKRLADDHRTLNGVMEMASIGVAGFGAVQSAMALSGAENENLQKSLQKLMAAQTLMNSINQIAKALEKESAAMLLLKDIRTKILTSSTYAYATAQGVATKGLKLMRIALISTGIGALIVGIGLLIANFSKVTGFIKKGIQSFDKLGGVMKIILLPITAVIEAFKLVKKGLQAVGVLESEQEKQAKARHKAKMERYLEESRALSRQSDAITEALRVRQKALNDEIEMLEAQGKKTANLQRQKLLNEIETSKKKAEISRQELELAIKNDSFIASSYQILYTKRLKFIKENERKLAVFDAKTNTERLSNFKSYADNRLNASRKIEDMQNSLLEAGIEKEIEINSDKFRRLREDTKKNEKLNSKEKKKLIELLTDQEEQGRQKIKAKYDKIDSDREKKRLENIEKQNNDFLDKIAAIEEQNYQNTLSDEERELRAVQDKYFALEEAAQGNADALNEIEIARLNEENNIKLKFQDEQYKNQQDIDNKKKSDANALAEYRVDVATKSLTAINDIAELFSKGGEKQAKRAFNVQKAVGIAQATINTAQAITKVFAETTDFTPTQSLRIANAVAIGVSGAAQVAAIASQKFEGGGGGETPSVDASGGGAAQAPSFNVVGDSGINQLAELQQAPVQAFVVSGEVTTSQALDRNRVENATL